MQKNQNSLTSKQIKYIILVILICCLLIVLAYMYRLNNTKKYDVDLYKEIIAEYNNIYTINEKEDLNTEEINQIISKYKSNETSNNVIGKLAIPKINLNTPILCETTEQLMKIAPTKYSGPDLNDAGNVVIIGHNYYNEAQFSSLNKLKKGDEIIITDLNGYECIYEVYEKEVIRPDDFSCINENKEKAKSFVTLITCANGIENRLVVKCVEKI